MSIALRAPRVTSQKRRVEMSTSAGPGAWRRPNAGSTERGYTYAWQKAREGWLKKHPICVLCEEEGVIKSATVVDHKIPHRGDMVLFWDRSNWQSMCKTHHDGKKQREERSAHGMESRLP